MDEGGISPSWALACAGSNDSLLDLFAPNEDAANNGRRSTLLCSTVHRLADDDDGLGRSVGAVGRSSIPRPCRPPGHATRATRRANQTSNGRRREGKRGTVGGASEDHAPCRARPRLRTNCPKQAPRREQPIGALVHAGSTFLPWPHDAADPSNSAPRR